MVSRAISGEVHRTCPHGCKQFLGRCGYRRPDPGRLPRRRVLSAAHHRRASQGPECRLRRGDQCVPWLDLHRLGRRDGDGVSLSGSQCRRTSVRRVDKLCCADSEPTSSGMVRRSIVASSASVLGWRALDGECFGRRNEQRRSRRQMRRRPRLPREMTGVDILLAEASKALERVDLGLPKALVDAPAAVARRVRRPAEMSDPGFEADRSNSPCRPTAPRSRGSSHRRSGRGGRVPSRRADTQAEALRIAIIMAMRFAAYLEATATESQHEMPEPRGRALRLHLTPTRQDMTIRYAATSVVSTRLEASPIGADS
jgi:hypothetical protein